MFEFVITDYAFDSAINNDLAIEVQDVVSGNDGGCTSVAIAELDADVARIYRRVAAESVTIDAVAVTEKRRADVHQRGILDDRVGDSTSEILDTGTSDRIPDRHVGDKDVIDVQIVDVKIRIGGFVDEDAVQALGGAVGAAELADGEVVEGYTSDRIGSGVANPTTG